MYTGLGNKLTNEGLWELKDKVDLLGKAEKDLLTAVELDHDVLRPTFVLRSLDRFCEEVVSSETVFAKNLNVPFDFSSPSSPVSPYWSGRNTPRPTRLIASPYYIAPIDVKWFEILLEKLLEIAILLSSGEKTPGVQMTLKRDNSIIYIKIIATFRSLTRNEQIELFQEYYGSLGTGTNLHLGSGLEGYIVKNIATRLNIPLGLDFSADNSKLIFILKLNRRLN